MVCNIIHFGGYGHKLIVAAPSASQGQSLERPGQGSTPLVQVWGCESPGTNFTLLLAHLEIVYPVTWSHEPPMIILHCGLGLASLRKEPDFHDERGTVLIPTALSNLPIAKRWDGVTNTMLTLQPENGTVSARLLVPLLERSSPLAAAELHFAFIIIDKNGVHWDRGSDSSAGYYVADLRSFYNGHGITPAVCDTFPHLLPVWRHHAWW